MIYIMGSITYNVYTCDAGTFGIGSWDYHGTQKWNLPQSGQQEDKIIRLIAIGVCSSLLSHSFYMDMY